MYCPNCGAQNTDDASFCAGCGKPLAKPAGAPPPPLTPPPPPPTSAAGSAGPPVPNYLVWSILMTIFCCLPVGVAAIIFSAQVNGKLAAGDRAGAERASKTAKILIFVGAGVGLLGAIIWGLVMCGGMMAAMQGGGY